MARGKKAAKELSPEEKLQQALVPVEEQPYPIPENWCWEYGVSIFLPMETQKPNGEMFRYIDIESIDNKQQAVSEPKEMPVTKAPSRASRKLHSGDTIFSMVRPYLKNIAYIDETVSDAIASTGFYICTPRENVNSRYNYYMMISPYVVDGLNAFMKGDNSPSIRKDDIEGFPYPIPPLPEQQRIVDLIESLFAKLDEAKEKAQAVVDGFELRKSAILHKAFTGELTERWRKKHRVGMESWVRAVLIDVLKEKPRNGYSPKPVNYVTPYKSMTLSATTSGVFKDEYFKYVDETIPEDSYLWLKPGDILIQRANSLDKVGTSAIYTGREHEFIYPDLMMKLQVVETTSSQFVAYSLKRDDSLAYFRANATGTAGNMPKINQKVVSQTPLNLPTFDEQIEIVRILESLFVKVQQAKEAAEAVLSQIDTMKKAILARAFRGELGTNDPAEEWAGELIRSVL